MTSRRRSRIFRRRLVGNRAGRGIGGLIVIILGIRRLPVRARVKLKRLKDMREHALVDVVGPQEIQVLVVRHGDSFGVIGKLLSHHIDVDQAVAATVQERHWTLDVARRKPSNLVIPTAATKVEEAMGIVIEHLEGLVSDDLEPVHDALGRGEGVQVRIGGQLLVRRDIAGRPVEEKGERPVNDANKDGWVEKSLPHRGGLENAATTKSEIDNLGRSFDQGVDNAIAQSGRGHGGGQGDENVYLVIELRVDGQGSKRLGSALGEANVRQRGLAGGLENVGDGVGDVVEGELIHGEVPEGGRHRRAMSGLLRVLVATIVSKLSQDESAFVYVYVLLLCYCYGGEKMR